MAKINSIDPNRLRSSYARSVAQDYFPTFDPTDPIWDQINKLPAAYRKQLDPYLSYNYTSGLWDRIGDFFGWNTSADKYRMQMQDRARGALSGFQNDLFQNTFNSAQAQASRQRDAGLNPDLSGSAEGDPAAGLEQPISSVDPSIFNPPSDLLVNIASLFGSAASGLASVGTFTKLLADIKRTKSETSGVQIANAKQAWDYAGEYLSAFDPSTRLDFGEVDFTPDFFNDKIVASKVSALRDSAPGLSEEAYKMIEKAMKARSSDPSIMDAYYKNYRSALESKTDRVAAKSVYGSLDLADEVIAEQNRNIIGFQSESIKLQYEIQSQMASYQSARLRNDFDYEVWKQEHNVPEAIGEAELSAYFEQVSRSSAETLRAKYLKNWLTYLQNLEKKGDPGATYLLNALLQGGYAPLMNTSINGGLGPFKGSGSWSTLVTPGVEQPLQKIGEGIGSTYDPSNPFSWQNQKF